jgi:hypothetical protein
LYTIYYTIYAGCSAFLPGRKAGSFRFQAISLDRFFWTPAQAGVEKERSRSGKREGGMGKDAGVEKGKGRKGLYKIIQNEKITGSRQYLELRQTGVGNPVIKSYSSNK